MTSVLVEHLNLALGDGLTLLFTVLRVAVVYAVLLIVMRFAGRRQLGQLTPFDLLMLLLLSNVVQNAMIGPDQSLVGGLVGAGVLLGLNQLVARIPALSRRFEGDPETLVSDGRVMEDTMKRVGLSQSELDTALRKHGLADLSSVATAVLEMDGTISIIPTSAAR